MISREGVWFFSQSWRCWKDYYRLSYAEVSLMRELWDRRATATHSVTMRGSPRILQAGQILLSERRLSAELGIPRTTFQRIMRKLVHLNLVRRIENCPAEGVIFYLPLPQEVPALAVLQQYIVGQSVISPSTGIPTGKHVDRIRRGSTTGQQVGQVLARLTPRNNSEKNTCNATGEPGRGPYKENAIIRGKETHCENPRTESFNELEAPPALVNAALDGPLNPLDGPTGSSGDERSALPSQAAFEPQEPDTDASGVAGKEAGDFEMGVWTDFAFRNLKRSHAVAHEGT